MASMSSCIVTGVIVYYGWIRPSSKSRVVVRDAKLYEHFLNALQIVLVTTVLVLYVCVRRML